MSALHALRVLVLAEDAFVIGLYLYAFVELLREAPTAGVLRSMRRGRIARVLGSVILLVEGGAGVAARWGHDELNWRTPVLQVAVIMMMAAWFWLDRTRYQALDGAAPAAADALFDISDLDDDR